MMTCCVILKLDISSRESLSFLPESTKGFTVTQPVPTTGNSRSYINSIMELLAYLQIAENNLRKFLLSPLSSGRVLLEQMERINQDNTGRSGKTSETVH